MPMKAYNSDITVEEFIARHARPYDPATDNYFQEPFAKDTKVGKNSVIYNAHSYHTKVPPEGIVPYILHYTELGDLILDPFAGSGMTGVAALMTGRRVILNDLSPAACHIGYNYCTPCDVESLKREFDRIKQAVKDEFEWLYGTLCDKGHKGVIQYTIWSDVYACGRCDAEFLLWDVAVDPDSGKVQEKFHCPSCGKEWRRGRLKRVRSLPVITSYECQGGCNPKRKERRTTDAEEERINEIEGKEIPYWYPTTPFEETREMWRGGRRDAGITRVGDFYVKRTWWAIARFWNESQSLPIHIRHSLQFAITAVLPRASKKYAYGEHGGNVIK